MANIVHPKPLENESEGTVNEKPQGHRARQKRTSINTNFSQIPTKSDVVRLENYFRSLTTLRDNIPWYRKKYWTFGPSPSLEAHKGNFQRNRNLLTRRDFSNTTKFNRLSSTLQHNNYYNNSN